ncbi:sigma-70 family RNA polymerase sigma factor [Nevskia soli]|jgi:RNA polymerase sigma-70 factor (ECF subfamily)|uniref:sigma-70 family RNA polymerase sigma factor n=1 Tax=Nevskia soli TaxID=418856 RepID=UPI0015D8C022|nr:sigma-70 family RNA polymerase sigma factor [Nevskia soli]
MAAMQKYFGDPLDESELVQAAQAGDESAFAELTRRHYSSSFKLAVSILRDHHEAEDEVQNAYWKAFQHIRQFQQDAKFSTWMTRIVVNQCLMRLRQTRRTKFLFLDDVLIGEERGTMELVDRGETPEATLGSKELDALLRTEIKRIPPLLRNVFVLRDVDQLPMTEVAGRLGISVAAAKSRLLRARIELKSRLKKHCGRLGPRTLMA